MKITGTDCDHVLMLDDNDLPSRQGLLMMRTNIIKKGFGTTAANLRLKLVTTYKVAWLLNRDRPGAVDFLVKNGGFYAAPIYDEDELDRWKLPKPFDHCAFLHLRDKTIAIMFKLMFGGAA